MGQETDKGLDQLGKEIVNELIKQLIRDDKVASGNLINSLDYSVQEDADGYSLIITDNSGYLKYVDSGRKPGKMPPVNKIEKWITEKKSFRIKAAKGKNKIPSTKQVAFLIARKIGKNGIKPTDVIEKTINNILSKKQNLIDKIGEDYVNELVTKMLLEI